jgi:hypothetical protein
MIGMIAEIGIFAAFSRWKARLKTVEILQLSEHQPRTIPILDGKIKAMAGSPTKFQRENATRVIKLVRFISGTKAFEYAVQGAMNPKSKIRAKKRRILEVSTYL